MLGLGTEVPGYKVSFDRLVLAQVAMSEPVEGPSADARLELMRRRLNAYRSRGAVVELVRDLAEVSQAAIRTVPVPGAEVVGPAVAELTSRSIVRRLRRSAWLARWTWKDALAWFGHQDQGLRLDPVRVLVDLSVQAHSENQGVRQGVDDLLAAALLADLRDSLGHSTGRPWNALILVDNGDLPAVQGFVRALLRARRQADRSVPPDPVAIVVASSGELAANLAGDAPVYPRCSEDEVPTWVAEDAAQGAAVLPVPLGELQVAEVQQLAKSYAVVRADRSLRAAHAPDPQPGNRRRPRRSLRHHRRRQRPRPASRRSPKPARSNPQPKRAGVSASRQPRSTARYGSTCQRTLDGELVSHALQLNAEHWARTGHPASAETLRIQLRVGASTARALKDHVR
jgi:hypothetical protein